MPAPLPLLLADVPWLLYRSYFALPKSIVGAEGQPVNALLGTVNALLGVIGPREAPTVRAVVACTGAEEAAYRVELFAAYHAHRDPMPAELRWQWQRAEDLLASLGWIVSSSDSLEADAALVGATTHSPPDEQLACQAPSKPCARSLTLLRVSGRRSRARRARRAGLVGGV